MLNWSLFAFSFFSFRLFVCLFFLSLFVKYWIDCGNKTAYKLAYRYPILNCELLVTKIIVRGPRTKDVAPKHRYGPCVAIVNYSISTGTVGLGKRRRVRMDSKLGRRANKTAVIKWDTNRHGKRGGTYHLSLTKWKIDYYLNFHLVKMWRGVFWAAAPSRMKPAPEFDT